MCGAVAERPGGQPDEQPVNDGAARALPSRSRRAVVAQTRGEAFRLLCPALEEVGMADRSPVSELRLVVTAEDFEEALRFYRDVLGLAELADYSSPNGRVRLLDAGRATLELTDPANAAFVDEV